MYKIVPEKKDPSWLTLSLILDTQTVCCIKNTFKDTSINGQRNDAIQDYVNIAFILVISRNIFNFLIVSHKSQSH